MVCCSKYNGKARLDGKTAIVTGSNTGIGKFTVLDFVKRGEFEYENSYQLSLRLINYRAVPWLRSLVAGLPPRKPGFATGSIHVGFVVDKVALGQVFLRVIRFSPVNIIPPSLSKLISSEAHPASCTVDTGGHFPGPKARPRRDTDHSPPSSGRGR
jgi:hypothetical protein